MSAKQLAAATVVAIAIVAAMPVVLAHDEQHEGERPEVSPGLVRDVRQATQRFQDVTAATAAGYVSASSCESGPNRGAMGVHYVNEVFIADGVLDVQRPEVLVYEPHEGQLRLVAVEFFVDAQQWDAANAAPPVLGGQLFNYAGAPNRLRLPAHYQLHVLGMEEKLQRHLQRLEPEGVVCRVRWRGSEPRLVEESVHVVASVTACPARANRQWVAPHRDAIVIDASRPFEAVCADVANSIRISTTQS